MGAVAEGTDAQDVYWPKPTFITFYYITYQMRKLYFVYTYNCGGLADMIKGSATAWYLAQKTGRTFHILFQHELGILFRDKLASRSILSTLPMLRLIDGKTSHKLISTITNEQSDIGVLSNTTLDFFETDPKFLVTIRPYLQTFYTAILPISRLDPLFPEFQVLHCRMGDKTLTEATNKSDNRIGSMESYKAKLAHFIATYANEMPTLVCTDHEPTQKELLESLPNAWSINKKPYHFAYNTRTIPQSEIIESIQSTLQEHEMMTRAKRIVQFVYSGFPILASAIGHVPIFLLKEDGLEPYQCEWITSE